MSGLSTPTRYKLSIEDYHKLAEVGILNEDSRVELIEGELIEMAPIGPPHSWMVNRLNKLLVTMAGDEALVSVQNSVRLPPNSEPQPDLVLQRAHMAGVKTRIAGPSDVLLVIEVSHSTLAYDRGTKIRLYAKSGIQEVWIVNIQEECIETYRSPSGASYEEKTMLRKGDTVALAAIPDLDIDVATLFA